MTTGQNINWPKWQLIKTSTDQKDYNLLFKNNNYYYYFLLLMIISIKKNLFFFLFLEIQIHNNIRSTIYFSFLQYSEYYFLFFLDSFFSLL